MNWESLGTATSYAVPTLDHYLPMIYTIALQGKDEPITFFHEGFQNASISMRCFRIGWFQNVMTNSGPLARYLASSEEGIETLEEDGW